MQKEIDVNKILISFFMLLSTLSLATNNTHSKEKLVLWTSNEHIKKAVDSVAMKFKKDFDTEVDVVVLNRKLTSKFQTAAMAGKGPDILTWAHDVVGELAASGLIEPLSIAKSLENSFFKVAIDAFTYKGRLYGYPYDLEALGLIYNKKFVKSAPKSWEELIRISKRIRKENPKNFGMLYNIGDFFFSFPLLSARGGHVFKTKNGKIDVHDVGLANTGAIEGGELISRLVKEKIVPASTDRSIAFNKMKKGELAMTIDGPWAISDLLKSGIEFGVSPIPSYKGMPSRPFVGVHGFMIRRSSKKKELAREFVENYLVTKKGILGLYKLDPRGPSRKDVLLELSDDPYLQGFVKSAAVGIPMPNVPQMSVVWTAMKSALRLITSGKELPKQALLGAKEQIDTAINKR